MLSCPLFSGRLEHFVASLGLGWETWVPNLGSAAAYSRTGFRLLGHVTMGWRVGSEESVGLGHG